jgi:hypothetical protein
MTYGTRQLVAAARPLTASFSTALVSVASHPALVASENVVARVVMFALIALAITLSGPAAPAPAAAEAGPAC